ncbi:hypothetical protein RB195_005189 [Necator americanus]|uniref:Uncharacterized protein n=1 Tax=Necator americanus TaxID=51031 RepID=A0ABR1BN74_NECAM
MPREGEKFIPEASTEFVQISREELEEMRAHANRSSAPAATGLQSTVPSSSSKPIFTKPDDFDIRNSLGRAITLLTQRNELLTIADTDPDVFDFYDQHARTESMQTTNPILAAFLREKKKKEDKKPAVPRTAAWKTRRHPYMPPSQPFRCIEAPKLMWVRENSSSAYENYKFVADEIEMSASVAILEKVRESAEAPAILQRAAAVGCKRPEAEWNCAEEWVILIHL